MTGSLTWKIKRIRRMGSGEILFRSARLLSQKVEQQIVGLGWTPRLPGRVTSGTNLLPQLVDFLPDWQARYELDTSRLDDLMQGNMVLFGHHKVELNGDFDWHRDPDTGLRSPLCFGKSINYRDDSEVGNVKVIWELARHHHLVPLATAYAVSGDRRYLEAVCTQLESWIEQNPFSIGIHWCSSLEVALRLISWSIVHSLICARDGEQGLFGAVNDAERLGESIYQQAWFIRHLLSRHSSANNHLFGELTGLWVACHVFDLGKAGSRWRAQCAQELEAQLHLQVFEDGVDKEQALYYHLWMLEYGVFIEAASRRFGTPFSSDFHDRLAAMTRFVRDITPIDGTPPQIGDADDGFVTRFTPQWPDDSYGDVLAAADSVLYNSAQTLTHKAFWYGVIGECNDSKSRGDVPAPNPYPRIYPAGGYAILGNRDCHLVFDAGSLGYLSIAAHGHADALNINLALAGKWWLIDPGTYAYHSRPVWRDHFRGTRAHNCVVVDGRDQSILSGPFMWLHHAKAWIVSHDLDSVDRQTVTGCHDGYQGVGVMHSREIQVDTTLQEIQITDRLDGKGIHDVEIWFQCAPDVQAIKPEEGPVMILSNTDTSHMLTIKGDSTLDWRILRGQKEPNIAGWYSSRLDQKQPSNALCGSAQLNLPVQLVTRLNYQLDSD